jgi:hypothetical protein
MLDLFANENAAAPLNNSPFLPATFGDSFDAAWRGALQDVDARPQTFASWSGRELGVLARTATDPTNSGFWLILVALLIGILLVGQVRRANLRVTMPQLQLDPRLDPREWKKEHRIALIGAAALGAFICFVFAAIHTKAPYWSRGLGDIWWYDIPNGHFSFVPSGEGVYLLGLSLWVVFGSLVGGSLVYITQLLRK